MESDSSCGVAVFRARQTHIGRHEIARLESGIQRRQPNEARDEQSSGDEKDLGNRELAGHQQQL
jgi:hypothetical protein